MLGKSFYMLIFHKGIWAQKGAANDCKYLPTQFTPIIPTLLPLHTMSCKGTNSPLSLPQMKYLLPW